MLAVLMVSLSIVGWLRVNQPELLEKYDWLWYDRYAEFEPDQDIVDNYVVVLIDDESLESMNAAWPMSRAIWGDLLSKLGRGKARSVAIDAWFEKPITMAGLDLTEQLLDDLDTLPEEEIGPQARGMLALADKDLGEINVNRKLQTAVLEAGNVLLGMACLDQPGALGPRPVPDWLKTIEGTTLKPEQLTYPCPELSTAYDELGQGGMGSMGLNAHHDPDGIIRRYPLYFGYEGHILPNMAAAVMSIADRVKFEPVMVAAAANNRGLPLIRPFDITRVRPVPFLDVLSVADDATLQQLFKDKRVFIGISALGSEDRINMPGLNNVPGVYSHVTAALNADHGVYVDTSSSALTYSIIGSLVVVFLLGLFFASVSWMLLLPTCLVGLGGYLALAVWALDHGVLITVVPWTLGVFAVFFGNVSKKLMEGYADRKRVKQVTGAFEHYVAPEVIDVLLNDPEKLKLGGERQEITAFFSDVAGFTSLSEKVEPTVLVELLNQVLGDMTTIIIEEGGVVDKYIGDAVVAMFGAPVKHADHATRSIRASLRCQMRMAEIKEEWQQRDLPPVRVRIGNNTGVAVVGNIGSENRFDYTMMGDTVNLAARLEGINNYYGSDTLVGEKTYEQTRENFVFREIDRVRVKGKAQPISMYEPVAAADEPLDDELKNTLAKYAEGLEQYRAGEFARAIEIFEPLAAAGDGPSQALKERAEEYLETPPPEDWGGVYTMTSK